MKMDNREPTAEETIHSICVTSIVEAVQEFIRSCPAPDDTVITLKGIMMSQHVLGTIKILMGMFGVFNAKEIKSAYLEVAAKIVETMNPGVSEENAAEAVYELIQQKIGQIS